MPRLPAPVIAAAVYVCFSAAAFAADDPSLFEQQPTTVYAQLGLGTPVGWAGGEIERTVTRHLALSAGAGMGFAGPQVALMPRFRVGNRASAAFLGLGLSYGRYRREVSCLFDCATSVFEGTVAWANLEAGIEHRWEQGLSLRVFVGWGRVVAGELSCSEGGDLCVEDHDAVRSLPYLGAALGWSF